MSTVPEQPARLRVDPTIITPPRTTSLNVRQIILESPTSSILSFFDEDFEDIDLRGHSCNSSTTSISTLSTTNLDEEDDIELEAVSNTIISTIQLYRSNNYNLSSMSIGCASIKNKVEPKKHQNRLSRAFSKAYNTFNYRKHTSTTQKEPPSFNVFDDGREDLIYHGMAVKEMKSTLNSMVVSTEFNLSLSDIQLQKPEFAHLLSFHKKCSLYSDK